MSFSLTTPNRKVFSFSLNKQMNDWLIGDVIDTGAGQLGGV